MLRITPAVFPPTVQIRLSPEPDLMLSSRESSHWGPVTFSRLPLPEIGPLKNGEVSVCEFPWFMPIFPTSETFEVGDIQLNALLAFYRPKMEGSLDAIAFGLDAFLNTGDVETGTGFGQYVIAPYLAASFYPADEIMITPIIEEYISLDDDSTGRERNDLSFRINTTLTIDQFWVTLVPELLIDMLGRNKNLWALRSSLGYMFSERSGISAEVVSQLAGEKRFNYLGRLNYRYMLP